MPLAYLGLQPPANAMTYFVCPEHLKAAEGTMEYSECQIWQVDWAACQVNRREEQTKTEGKDDLIMVGGLCRW